MTIETFYLSSEWTLLIMGVGLWVRALIRGQMQDWLDAPSRLPAWKIHTSDFLILPLLVLVFMVLFPPGLAWVLGIQHTDPPLLPEVLAGGFGSGLALICAALFFRLLPGARSPEGSAPPLGAIVAGLLALVYFLPACVGLVNAWDWMLTRLGLPNDEQPILEFIRAADGVGEVSLWLFLVVIVAPVSEELIFRAGLYRFLAGRLPHRRAAVLSALLFACLHFNLRSAFPLFLLGMLLATLYQKTGRLVAAITLHATFNLHTMISILLGPRP